jgi:hypothetical protein
MRFDEPDTREAYRRAARDCFESLQGDLSQARCREYATWLEELETWEEFDPPLPPTPRSR